MKNIGWYSAKDEGPSVNGLSKFVDSKFALDKKTSVVRELVQNSIDAKVGKTVEIEINVDGVDRNKIPGIDALVERIVRCKEKANIDAEREYDSAIELLSKDIVYCLKVSDSLTTGVNADEDEKGDSQYRALVYDEGNSFGKGEATAGSHGVGKRAAFILSEANTVYYATRYKNKDNAYVSLFEGKCMLSTWYDDNEQKMCGDGWYGNIFEDEKPEKRVQPISQEQFSSIDEYFLRVNECGTDVIAVGIDYEGKEDIYKNLYINSVLENFYVGIIDGSINIKVFGVYITKETIEDVFNEYYQKDKATYLAGTNKCLLIGNLYDSKRVYKDIKPEVFDIELDGKKYGYIQLFYDDNNRKKAKYYSIIREHGMKIRDYKMTTEKEFSAVVKVNGKELNELLLKLENAAHDNFMTKADDCGVRFDETAVKALKIIKDYVENYIKNKTKIVSDKFQKITGLNSILSMPGDVSTAKIVKEEVKIVVPKPPKDIQPPKIKDKKIFIEYESTPRLIEKKDELQVVFECARSINKGCISFRPVDSDGKEVKGMEKYIGINLAFLDGVMLRINKSMYEFEEISKGEHTICLKNNGLLPYKYAIDIYENYLD